MFCGRPIIAKTKNYDTINLKKKKIPSYVEERALLLPIGCGRARRSAALSGGPADRKHVTSGPGRVLAF